jgi:hypothetical protein
VFYGLAAGLMWLHTLNFLLVQPDLGQAYPLFCVNPSLRVQCFSQNHTGPNDTDFCFLFDPTNISANINIIALLQFVRVLQNMAKDLGFFGFVWAVLVLAFSVFMLGATGGAQGAALSDKDQNDKSPPMQSWPLWWFLRTYLQSLGQVNSVCA